VFKVGNTFEVELLMNGQSRGTKPVKPEDWGWLHIFNVTLKRIQ
jgi:hypothetical protein